jgi:predicted small secreted protein
MRKLIYVFSLLMLVGTISTSCREKKTAGEKIQDGVEEVGDGIGDAVDNTVDKVDDAVEE